MLRGYGNTFYFVSVDGMSQASVNKMTLTLFSESNEDGTISSSIRHTNEVLSTPNHGDILAIEINPLQFNDVEAV